ncbi:hypothetical protein [Nocardia abscessus]|uniref:hypothetical protein n=1 Tax=Nocardia abscessus TaxID=120957 RepID=UPI00245443A7|nr:hypothetical protein [Nocardia abscessus]
MSNIRYDREFRVAGALDWEISYLGDHEADLAWMLFLDWACSEFEGRERLPGTPSREENHRALPTAHRHGGAQLRYNESRSSALPQPLPSWVHAHT